MTTTARVFHNVQTDHRGRMIGMCDGYAPGDAVTLVAVVDEPSTDHEIILEKIFFLFNCADGPAYGEPDPRAVEYRRRLNRSLSVGDVVGIEGHFYACGRIGWTEVPAPRTVEVTTYGTTSITEAV